VTSPERYEELARQMDLMAQSTERLAAEYRAKAAEWRRYAEAARS
jgi:hypothetical protein